MPCLRRLPLLSALGLLLATAISPAVPTAPPAPPSSLNAELALLRETQRLPGIAAVLLREGRPLAAGVAGLRHVDEPGNAIGPDDRFAVGSLTKRLTALMVARLVDAGRLRWDLRLAEALPDVPMRAEYRDVTLAQLLSFQGGLPAYNRVGPQITPELFDTSGSPAEREARFVRHVLQQAPAAPPGGAAVYSNASYLLAAHVAARVTGESYPELMRTQVLEPLGLKSAGWGRPRSQAELGDQPWLHVTGPEGAHPLPDRPRPPDELFIAAGGLHMSLPDLARVAQVELMTRRGAGGLLQPASAERWLGLAPGSAASTTRGVFAGGTPWLSACYAIWPLQSMVMALAVNGGSREDAACKAMLERVEAEWLG